jgi:hydroxypyruvate reductase
MTALRDELAALLPRLQRLADPSESLAQSLRDGRLTLPPGRLHVLALGKASRTLAIALDASLHHLHREIARALVIAVPGQDGPLAPPWEVTTADHPLPTPRNLDAARRVAEFVHSTPPDDPLLVLLSGGGSAQLTLPRLPLTLDHLSRITRALQRAGATITQLNAVRKHLEQLKGGQLAALRPQGLTTLAIVSDVIGDPVDVISSGPFSPDRSTFADALDALLIHHCASAVPQVTAFLRDGTQGRVPETPKPHADAALFSRVSSTILASNARLVTELASSLRAQGAPIALVQDAVEGDAAHVGVDLAQRLRLELARAPHSSACVFILGGETTVAVGNHSGMGGPSQELALACAGQLEGMPGWALLTYSTDGVDGPSPAAGALVDGTTFPRIRAAGLDPQAALLAHDSTRVLTAVGDAIITGPTGTNINHIAVAIVGAS